MNGAEVRQAGWAQRCDRVVPHFRAGRSDIPMPTGTFGFIMPYKVTLSNSGQVIELSTACFSMWAAGAAREQPNLRDADFPQRIGFVRSRLQRAPCVLNRPLF